MRKKENEIKDRNEIEDIINRAEVCRIGLSDNDIPYVVPVVFGYRDGVIYIHSSSKGKKIDIIKKNSNVCFEVDIIHQMIKTKSPCSWTHKHKSVIGFGKASLIKNPEEKKKFMDIIMQHYSSDSFEYNENSINKLIIIKIEIESMTGKKSSC